MPNYESATDLAAHKTKVIEVLSIHIADGTAGQCDSPWPLQFVVCRFEYSLQ